MQEQRLQDDDMVITSKISYPVTIADRPDPPFKRGTWVRLTGGKTMYLGDIGCVFRSPEDHNERYCQVVLTPQVPASQADFEYWASKTKPKHKRPRPTPSCFLLADALRLYSLLQEESAERWSILGKAPAKPIVRSCLPDCDDPLSCSHNSTLKSFVFQKESYVGGFLIMKVPIQHLAEGSNPDPLTFSIFAAAGDAVGIVLSKVPKPSSWIFELGNNVMVPTPRLEGENYLEHKFAGGAVANVTAVHENECKVEVHGGIFLKPMLRLRKYFEIGQEVLYPNPENKGIGDCGMVAGVDEKTWNVLVILQGMDIASCHVNELVRAPPEEPSVLDTPMAEAVRPSQSHRETSAGRCPWLNLPVRITRHPGFVGYRGHVYDVKKDTTTVSGLLVLVRLDAGYTAREAWVDYDHLRRQR